MTSLKIILISVKQNLLVTIPGLIKKKNLHHSQEQKEPDDYFWLCNQKHSFNISADEEILIAL